MKHQVLVWHATCLPHGASIGFLPGSESSSGEMSRCAKLCRPVLAAVPVMQLVHLAEVLSYGERSVDVLPRHQLPQMQRIEWSSPLTVLGPACSSTKHSSTDSQTSSG